MKTYLFEATNGTNWGKFMVGVHDVEWTWSSKAEPAATAVLRSQGWSHRHLWVLDLATGEGALFAHGGHARNDLNRNRIHVCILFEAFLEWLYMQDITLLEQLPRVVDLPHVEPRFFGYRRPGRAESETDSA